MAFDPDLAIFTLIVFAILFVVLRKFAWKPMAEALDRRERTIAEQIAAAERTHAEARHLLAEYERKLAASQDEVRAILEEARRDAAHTGQEIVAKASGEASAVMERAKREIETAKSQALKELAKHSARLALDLAGRIVRKELDSAGHARLIEEAMAKFPVGAANSN